MTSYQRLKIENQELKEQVKQLEQKIFNLVNYPDSEESIIEVMRQQIVKNIEDQLMKGNPSIKRVDCDWDKKVIGVTLDTKHTDK